MTVGWTVAEARRVKRGIDRDMAAIEERVARMQRRVPDVTLGGFRGQVQLEELRELARELHAIVDRRTRL